MTKAINFNKLKKRYLTITLNDEAETTIMIRTPTKKVLTAIMDLKDTLASVSEEDITEDDLDGMYNLCAEIMSHNKTGTKIDAGLLGEIFDFDDITYFLTAYMEFVNESTPKN